jgi:hypothetical protein
MNDWKLYEANQDAFWILHPLVGKICSQNLQKNELRSTVELLHEHLTQLLTQEISNNLNKNQKMIDLKEGKFQKFIPISSTSSASPTGSNISVSQTSPISNSYHIKPPSSITGLVGQIIIKYAPGSDYFGRSNMVIAQITRVFRSEAPTSSSNIWMADLIFENGSIDTSTVEAVRKMIKLTIKENRYQR